MNVDRYTKLVLTTIAVCLMVLCFERGTLSVKAQQQPLPVLIVGVATAIPVGLLGTRPIMNNAGHIEAWNYDAPVRVIVQNESVPPDQKKQNK